MQHYTCLSDGPWVTRSRVNMSVLSVVARLSPGWTLTLHSARMKTVLTYLLVTGKIIPYPQRLGPGRKPSFIIGKLVESEVWMSLVGLNGHYLKTDRTWVFMVQTQATNLLANKIQNDLWYGYLAYYPTRTILTPPGYKPLKVVSLSTKPPIFLGTPSVS